MAVNYMELIYLERQKLIEQNIGGMMFDLLQAGNLRLEFLEDNKLGDHIYKIYAPVPYEDSSEAYDYLWHLVKLGDGHSLGYVVDIINKRQNSSKVMKLGKKECADKYCEKSLLSKKLTEAGKKRMEEEYNGVAEILEECDNLQKYADCCQLAYHFCQDKKIRDDLKEMPAENVTWCDIPMNSEDIYKITATIMDIGFVNGATYGPTSFQGEIFRTVLSERRRG